LQLGFIEVVVRMPYNITMDQKHFESLYPENARDSEIEQLVAFIKEGNSSQLVGLSGSGRSNVLGLLTYNTTVRLRHFPKHHGIVHFVMVNFSEIKMRPYPEVVKFIFLCLDSSLADRGMNEEYEKVDALFKEALSFNDELVLVQRLKSTIDYLAVEKKLTVIFLFNQFDDYIPQVNEELFILLRSLRDRAKYRFSVIFSVSRPLEDSVESELLSQFSDFLVGHTIYLELFDEVSISFRIAYLEKLTGKTLPETTKKEVLALTGGHLRLVKNSTEALLADQQQFNNKAIEQFLLSQKTIQSALKSIWKELTPSEKAFISDPLPAQDDSVARIFLESVGLLRAGEITIPLFVKAVKNGLFKESEGKLVYDEVSNAIKKGDEIISDSLTKAEFRLLRYLLQHPDEIIERETIVGTVWQDDKSIKGISEQAIDQLIFRLRRKIEEDPNSPSHLQTVKGRGIRFIS
jgi:hypothetical protein